MTQVQVIVERDQPLPRSSRLTIVAQDPSVLDDDGRPLLATARVPADWTTAGPRSHRFHVVGYDTSAARLREPVTLAVPEFPGADGGWELGDLHPTLEVPVDSPDAYPFHAQNVYAIAARTLASFERALGRRLPWSFGDHQLYLVPHAFVEANAYYSPDDHAVLFGYFPAGDGRTVFSCLSHDIVAHEVTHALLDGLRPRYQEPSLPDQAAFHEAFADIVALLSVMSLQEVVAALLGPAFDDGRITESQVSEAALRRNALFQLAEQLGEAALGQRGVALRRSVELEPSEAWKTAPGFDEPHRRGEVLVAAVMQTLLAMWRERLVALIHAGQLDRRRAAEEGAKAASHLLNMAIRAVDYTPPIELEFADFVDAVLLADQVVAPDDEHGYRGSLTAAFARFGIHPPERHITDLADHGPMNYHNINFQALTSQPDEVFRFLWQNADLLDISSEHWLRVESIRPTVRVGPDGLIVHEAVADYVQALDATAVELEALGLARPTNVTPDTTVRCWGGGAVVFDQFGKAKYHQTKPLLDWQRQSRRLAWLAAHGLHDTRDRYGFSLGIPHGQQFAQLHDPAARAGESW